MSGHLELPPIATYASLNLWNFSSPHETFTDLDSLRALHTFSGTNDEEWFYIVSVAMEAEGASLIQSLLQRSQAIIDMEYSVVIEFLEDFTSCVGKLGVLLERMYERCDTKVFFFGFRPFLAGSMNMEAAGLPNGVFFSDGKGKGHWEKLRGGSNGQSPLVQFLDIVLGIEHTSNGGHSAQANSTACQVPSFHEEVRNYMPGPHRRFLERISEVIKIRQFAMLPSTTPQHTELQHAYQTATKALTEFRNKHLKLVTRYIILPSKLRNEANSGRVNLSVPSQPEAELTGAGGTALMPFLKQSRDETAAAGRVVG